MSFLPTCTKTRLLFNSLQWTNSLRMISRYKKWDKEDKESLERKNEKWNKQSVKPSLLAQKMVQQSNNSKIITSDKHYSSLDVQKSRVENLLTELDLLSSHPMPISNNLDSDIRLSSAEDELESIMFPEDITTPKTYSPMSGTEDPSIPPSDVPCVGCGAPLHCQHNTFPGFLPSEYFKSLTPTEMKTSICQRCYYMRHCNAFVEVSSTPDEYKDLITKIRPTQSAVVLVVDVIDIQGSIIPNLMEYIGSQHPLIVVGNKSDLLSPDCEKYLSRVTERLRAACYQAGLRNIRKVTLASAKTGFGLERLINMLFSFYKQRVDVYIVGTANAGKSSLFNALLASDYCKSSARNLIERATISVWPGTTLNLLKFPIQRPSHRVHALRKERLKQEEAQRKLQQRIERERSRKKDKTISSWSLTNTVGMTDIRSDEAKRYDEGAWGQTVAGYRLTQDGTLETNDEGAPLRETYDADKYDQGYWMFDTPGIINPNQVLNLLTPEEMTYVTPSNMMVPRCLTLKPQQTLFMSGLVRLDLLQADCKIMLAVHSGPNIPIHVVDTSEADDFYRQFLGSPTLGIPTGNQARLMKLPSLVGKQFQVEGESSGVATTDIQLSSLGWVSIAPQQSDLVFLRVFTPGRKGMYLRTPALMPQYWNFKGRRIGSTPFYRTKPPGWVMAKAKS